MDPGHHGYGRGTGAPSVAPSPRGRVTECGGALGHLSYASYALG